MRNQVSAVLPIAFSSRTATPCQHSLVVINEINIKSFAVLKTKDNSPIGRTVTAQKPRSLPFKGWSLNKGWFMPSIVWAAFKSSQDLTDSSQHVDRQPAPIIVLEKCSQPFVAKRLSHCRPGSIWQVETSI
jgi:hypothetical protein